MAATVDGWGPYLSMLRSAGHVPSEWGAPNGYPQAGAAWLNSNTTLQVWQLMGWLAAANTGGPFGKGPGPAATAWHQDITYDGVIGGAAQRITGQSIHRAHRAAIAALAGVSPEAKPPSTWRRGGTTQHTLIHFGILASEYMELR